MPGQLIPRLHIVTDDAILARSDFLQNAIEMLVIVQRHMALHIRGHNTPARKIFDITASLAPKAPFVQSLVVVNDRLDIALATQAGGVQLGTRSLPVDVARRIAGTNLAIGYSAHAAVEAAEAERAGANFILAGNIYEKKGEGIGRGRGGGGGGGIGVEGLAEFVNECSIPILAIGGVNDERTHEVVRTGAYGVAVIRAVWDAPDPVQAAEQLSKILYD